MATIKSYTDLEQSKKLVEILPIESEDMHYVLIDTDEDKYDAGLGKYIGILPHYPCWSLAALLEIIPGCEVSRIAESDKWETSAWNDSNFELLMRSVESDNPVDACYELILKLNELNLL